MVTVGNRRVAGREFPVLLIGAFGGGEPFVLTLTEHALIFREARDREITWRARIAPVFTT